VYRPGCSASSQFNVYCVRATPRCVSHAASTPKYSSAWGLKVRVRDLQDFNRMHSKTLLALPGVRQIRTFFVLKAVLDDASLEF
jgi:hypothetical protein